MYPQGRQVRLDEAGDVFGMVPEGREGYDDITDAVEEILSYRRRLDQLVESFIGGGDEPEVGGVELRIPEASVLSTLQETEEVGLEVEGEVLHLIEEEGRAVGLPDKPVELDRPVGEGTFGVAEEHRFAQGVTEQGAVDRDDVAVGGLEAVEELGGQLLAGARLPVEVDRALMPAPARELPSHLHHRLALSDEATGFVGAVLCNRWVEELEDL